MKILQKKKKYMVISQTNFPVEKTYVEVVVAVAAAVVVVLCGVVVEVGVRVALAAVFLLLVLFPPAAKNTQCVIAKI